MQLHLQLALHYMFKHGILTLFQDVHNYNVLSYMMSRILADVHENTYILHDFVAQREDQFTERYPSFEPIFHSLVDGDVGLFQEGLLHYIQLRFTLM